MLWADYICCSFSSMFSFGSLTSARLLKSLTHGQSSGPKVVKKHKPYMIRPITQAKRRKKMSGNRSHKTDSAACRRRTATGIYRFQVSPACQPDPALPLAESHVSLAICRKKQQPSTIIEYRRVDRQTLESSLG